MLLEILELASPGLLHRAVEDPSVAPPEALAHRPRVRHPCRVSESSFMFPPGLNTLIAHGSGEAVFGLNVLEQLISVLTEAASAPRSSRLWGPGVLGCAMWMDDPDLVDVLGRMANVCVVVTKQPLSKYERPETSKVKDLAASAGLAQNAFHELSDLAPHQDGRPTVVGPWVAGWADNEIGGVREVGFRRVGERLVPIVHAKILLLGDMFWTDEHPSGAVADVIGFRPRRLWVGSANFTKSSRSSLEMGIWTTDPAMLAAARTWLLSLVAISEPLGAGADVMEPELLPVEYDDDAIREYLSEVGGWFVDEN